MSFRVISASVPASAQEWQQARTVPASELPELNELQRDEVRRFSLNEEEYRRFRVLLRGLVRNRQERQGREFGELIEGIIQQSGEGSRLTTVSRRGTPLGWRVTIRHPKKGVVEFQTPLEVVEALVTHAASVEEIEGYREQVLQELSAFNQLEVAS